MRRNKIRKKPNIKSNFYFKTIGIMLVLTTLGILYVWQNVQAVKIGYQIKQKEKEIKILQKKLRGLEIIVARLKMPNMIKKKLNENNISLSVPDSWQIVKIPQPLLYFNDCFTVSPQENIYEENKAGKTLIKIKKT